MGKKIFIKLYLLFAICSSTIRATDIGIIPYPQSLVVKEKVLNLPDRISIYVDPSFAKQFIYLKDELQKRNLKVSKVSKADKALISLNKQVLDFANNNEAYALEVMESAISIKSEDRAGMFYGIQSLLQLIDRYGTTISCLEIEDYPNYKWRSFMLDEGRYFKGEEVVKKLLDEIAFLKFNVFQWHLTDDQGWRIEIKKYPKLTEIGAFRDSTQVEWYESNNYDGIPHGGFYTQEQIKEIIQYAADRNITIVPEIEMPGHSAAAIAAYPWLSAKDEQIKVPTRFGVQYDVFDVSDDRVISFLEDVLDEVMTLFPGEVIHIGGDEVRYDQWNESTAVQDFIKKHNLGNNSNLQVWFTNRMSQFIKDRGRRMMGWNDIAGDKIHHFQEDGSDIVENEELAEGTVIQFWKGDHELITRSARKGYDIVNSYNNHTYLNYDYEYNALEATYEFQPISLKQAYKFSPIPNNFPSDLKNKIIGGGCQMWGEWIPTEESMNKRLYPRIAAYAEAFWTNDKNKDYNRFRENINFLLDRWKSRGYKYGPLDSSHK